ncbi:MAG: hypothetical protein HQL46_03985 [Gammaproteobacteria bacterium]|nr:hypothetical protein [Gammaproteobacteria bacterium]
MMSENIKIDPVVKVSPVYIVKHKSDGESPSPKDRYKKPDSKSSETDEVDSDVVDNQTDDNFQEEDKEDKADLHIDELA